MIQTTVEKLATIKGIEVGLIASVVYYDDLEDGHIEASEISIVEDFDFVGSLLKRNAFNHEQEVRLLAQFIDIQEDNKNILLDLDPNELIDSIVLDPRCEDWYHEAIKGYCMRSGLCVPEKSMLYKNNINEVTTLKFTLTQDPPDEVLE
ncbi:hypothetical protein J2736_003094 [Paenibacillus qinlingensis]|uniref:Uncharacterized protein n=2 Tax=Paenibacillus qinlingensis TaxID=1837343 RepID=A0ABU1NWR7_9BACL|nr:hypothetical protein [Paenibacillus qinlingensis]MDR6551905.1 hypothetical protein [Paenibacillus qinlingensis]